MNFQKFTAILFITFLIIIGNVGFIKAAHKEKSGKSTAKEIFGKDWILREDLSVLSNPKIKSLQANIYQKDDKLRLTFLLSKKSDVKKTDCKISFDPMYFFVLGKPVLIDSRTVGEIEIDYKFENERVIFKVKPSNRL
jgi:hypothetical protein